MNGHPTDEAVTELLAQLRVTYAVCPVEPDDRVAALFAAGPAAEAASHTAAEMLRRRAMVSETFRRLPGKVAAGIVGAVIGWGGLGLAGAAPGPVSLVSDDDAVELTACLVDTGAVFSGDVSLDDCTEEDGSAADGTLVAQDDADEGDDGDAAGGGKAAVTVDGELPLVPTSVSEAAHIHDFDDECENHGAYVSYFAQHGAEPECATAARAAGGNDAATAQAADGESDDGKGKGQGKGEGKKAQNGRGRR